MKAVQHYQFYTDVQIVRSWTVLHNDGANEAAVEYLSSFALTGVDKEGSRDRNDKIKVSIAHSGWQSELQWKSYSLPELGMSHLADRGSSALPLAIPAPGRRLSCSDGSAGEHGERDEPVLAD